MIAAFPQTSALLVPLLMYLVTPGGSGLAVSVLFAEARKRWPRPAQIPADPWLRCFYAWLHSPRRARYLVPALAGLLAICAAVPLALLTQQAIPGVVDVALSGALAALMTQAKHGLGLSDSVWS